MGMKFGDKLTKLRKKQGISQEELGEKLNVTNLSYMFNHCKNLLNLDLSTFNTFKVNNMSYMFYFYF